jgi:hypothetical protein
MAGVTVVSGFFIEVSFGRGCGPRAGNSDQSVFLIMNHKEETEPGCTILAEVGPGPNWRDIK